MPLNDLERELAEKSVWPAERLVKYLVADHEDFLIKRLPKMRENAINAEHEPLTQFIATLDAELRGHFRTEENIVFPVLVSLEHEDPGSLTEALQYACRHMESDHNMHERHLRLLAAFQHELEDKLDRPEVLPLIHCLDDFGRQMYLHMNIENRFLFKPYLKSTR
ncbi:MAG: hypothetical protein CMF59_14285 [Leptospiraceae bacterium]|nr:hypothetical protein [Leptospiraceae bacterium]